MDHGGRREREMSQVFCDAASALSDEEYVSTLHETGNLFAKQGGTADFASVLEILRMGAFFIKKNKKGDFTL